MLAERKKRAWTREFMCKRAKISMATGWRAERGPGVSLKVLDRIAKAFGMKLEELR